MAKVTIGPGWQALTTGTNNALVSPEGRVLLYIGTAAPTAADYGVPFNNERFEIGNPAQSWIRANEDGRSVSAIIFTY